MSDFIRDRNLTVQPVDRHEIPRDQRDGARITAAQHALDAADLRVLLEMLGLMPETDHIAEEV